MLQPCLFTKNIESLFNTVLVQDGIICDYVGWCSGFNKVGNIVEVVGIVFYNTVVGMGTNS